MNRRLELRRLLEAYEPSSGEARAMAEMLLLLTEPGDVFSRHHFAPGHFTASAFVVTPGAAEVALVFHSRLERWLQPGGHIEPGDEGVISAAQREVAEEIGLDVVIPDDPAVFDIDAHHIPAGRGEPGHVHFDVRFAFSSDGQPLQAGDGVSDARWLPLGGVAELGTDRSVLRAVAKLRLLAEGDSSGRRPTGGTP